MGELAACIGSIRNSGEVEVYLEIKELEMVLLEIRKLVNRFGIEKIQNVIIEGHLFTLHGVMGDCETP